MNINAIRVLAPLSQHQEMSCNERMREGGGGGGGEGGERSVLLFITDSELTTDGRGLSYR